MVRLISRKSSHQGVSPAVLRQKIQSQQSSSFENCYSVGHAVERSKLGLDWALGLGLASLGLPQGIIRSWDFRRMSEAAQPAQSCSRKVRLVGEFCRLVMQDPSLLVALADSLLAGEPTAELLFYRCSRTLGKGWRWLRPLTERYVKRFRRTRPRRRDVIRFLRDDAGLERAQSKYSNELCLKELLTVPQLNALPTRAAGSSGNSPQLRLRAIWQSG